MKNWKVLLLGLIIFHQALLASTQFIAWPEMLFWPYLILKGWLPYQDIGIAHSPLMVIALTGFYKIFGVGILQQQVFGHVLAFLSDILIFYILKNLFDIKIALRTVFFYVLFQVFYDGNGIWFDHALAIFPILLFLLLIKQNYFLVGVLWTIAFLTKQTAFWLLLPLSYAFLISDKKINFALGFTKGAVLIGILFSLFLLTFGIKDSYLSWTLGFGIGTLPSLAGRLPSLRLFIASAFPYLIFVPLLLRKEKLVFPLLIWSVASALGTFPRFELFHFQPALPFLALAFSLSLKKINLLTLVIIIMMAVIAGWGIIRNFNQPIRFYGTNDREIIEIVDGLTNKGDLIFVTNYWDNVYPLTGTIPSTRPFIPQLTQYLSQPGFEEENLADLILDPPSLVVRGQFSGPEDPFRFVKINDFIDNHYITKISVDGIDIMIPK